MNVKFQFLGLPDGLEERIKFVEDEFRTNELSHTIGGYLMIIEFWNQVSLAYINIKKPSKYLQVILDNYFDRTLNQTLSQVDDENGSKAMKVLRLALAKVFITKPRFIGILTDNKTALFECKMEEVWSKDSETLPWISAEKHIDMKPSEQLKLFSNILDHRTMFEFSRIDDLLTLPSGSYILEKEYLLQTHTKAVEFGTVSFEVQSEKFCFPFRPNEEMDTENDIVLKRYFHKTDPSKYFTLAANA